jgi:hypothetical protein
VDLADVSLIDFRSMVLVVATEDQSEYTIICGNELAKQEQICLRSSFYLFFNLTIS